MVGRQTQMHATLLLAAVSMLGCVNLNKRNRSNVPYPAEQGSISSATAGAMVAATQKAQSGPKRFAAKLKEVVMPPRSISYPADRIAKDDPTSLQHKVGPIGPDLYLASARLAERNGALDSAMDQYRKALRIDSRNRNAMIGLARLQHRTGDMQGAIQVYRKALEAYRNDPVILNDLGLCYARNGQLDQAISILRTATQAAPDREMYRNNLAAALVEANRADEAVAHLTQTYGAAVANYNVGYLLSQGGQADTARSYLQKAAQLDPSMQQAHNLLNETVPRVSSLPPTAQPTDTTREYRPPVARERDSELTLPQHMRRPTGSNEPSQPADSPSYFEQQPTRIGPFGYVPSDASETMVVSYNEPLEAPEPPALTPAYPQLQPVYPVTLPLRLPEREHWSGQGDLIPPTP